MNSTSNGTEENAGFFSAWNVGILGMMLFLLLYLLFKFTVSELLAIVKAVLGLSFVIFIHEMGHFLAAKWCGVNVTTFSIGFGPAIPGCQFTWGETTYKLAVLPLGGYVQMVGQVDGDEASDGHDDDPRSYRRKTVGQRMLIISAGVIMNAILAIFCFIAVYQGPGKEHAAAVINHVDSLAPAFVQGLPSGAEIIKIDTVENPTFSDFMQRVINSMKGEPIQITYRTFDKGIPRVVTTAIEPRMSEANGKAEIGVGTPPKTQLMPKRGMQEGPYNAETSAAQAKFEYGDVIIATTDPDDPLLAVTELPDDPRHPGHGQRDYFEFARRMQLLADKEITVRVRRVKENGDKKESTDVDLQVAPMYRLNLGVCMQMGPVLTVRENSPAHNLVRVASKEDKREADLIEAVSVIDADGKTPLVWKYKPVGSEKILDPERLPFELRQWSDRLDRAKVDRKGRMVTLHLSRHSDLPGQEKIEVKQKLEWDTAWRFDRAAPLSLEAPMPIPELGLAYQIKSIVVQVVDKNSRLRVGDVIKNLRYDYAGFNEALPEARELLYHLIPSLRPTSKEDVEVLWRKEDLQESQWARFSAQVFQDPIKFKKLIFKVEREKTMVEVEIPIQLDPTWPLQNRGWYLASDTRRVTASDPVQAVWMGLVDTKSRMMEIFQNLRGMILGRISFKNLGGPLTIARATYIFAFMDFTEFMFFLGLISINLAVVNFLPIPVLDGGHMVFLLYEKLRGKPASEGVRIGATYVGLGLILCLMCFVLYLDVSRLFF